MVLNIGVTSMSVLKLFIIVLLLCCVIVISIQSLSFNALGYVNKTKIARF